MKNFTFFLAVAACLLASKISAQQSFEARARGIAEKIENITKSEKADLKAEIEQVNKELESGTITKEQADTKKMQLAEVHAKKIESQISIAQVELKDLIQQKVDGKVAEQYKPNSFGFNFSKSKGKNKEKQKKYCDSISKISEKRTTSQFVFAAGINNLVTNNAVANSDFRYWGSHFYEWGVTANTRLFKNYNILHLKYGFSVMYNNLRPTEGRYFVATGNQTNLQNSTINYSDSRFRNVYITAPIHLEFDLTKIKTNADGNKIFKTHESVRLGIGGYVGIRVKTKQLLEFEENGHDISVKEKGGFNTNDFIYGVSTYLGYKATSLYLKYDLNPLFKDNTVKQNNISLGIRFDLN